MKRSLKKTLAIIGIVSVIASCILVNASANDIVNDSTNIMLAKDVYPMTTFQAWGFTNQVTDPNQKEMEAGNSMSAFINMKFYGDPWTSSDRWSLYYGSGTYVNVDMIHTGAWSARNGFEYQRVMTTFGTQDLFSQGVTLHYDNFLYDKNFVTVGNNYANDKESFDFYSDALIPMMLMEHQVSTPMPTILVAYTWSDYEIVKEENGKEHLVRRSHQLVQEARVSGGNLWYIPMLPCVNDEYGFSIGGYSETDSNWNETNAIYFTDLTVSIGIPNTLEAEDFKTTYLSYWSVEGKDEYPITYDDFVNQYPSNEPEIYDFGGWLVECIGGFLRFEIFPGVSILVILGTVVAIPLLVAFLKVFAGG